MDYYLSFTAIWIDKSANRTFTSPPPINMLSEQLAYTLTHNLFVGHARQIGTAQGDKTHLLLHLCPDNFYMTFKRRSSK